MNRLDIAIIGSGPAGLEAALNLKLRNKSFALFGSPQLSPKLETAPLVENYLGLPGISGTELKERFLRHLAHMEIEILPKRVTGIYPMGGHYALAAGADAYEATAVILATGLPPGKPFPGEEELLGRGLSYCATCDAALYKGKTVAVVALGGEAPEEANFLSEIAGKVYYISPKEAPDILEPGIHFIRDTVERVLGDKRVSALSLRKGGELAVDGVFVVRDSVSPVSLLSGIQMSGPYIQVDTAMQTSLPGCFAAGDCTGHPLQYMRAAGQGQTAALNAAVYLDQLKHKQKGGTNP